uniref:G2/mitotic-specific cyclin-B3 n=1 Tax=Caenorhabditis japonica TaxID=281687 RepID=A0A8R1DI56_CAEJA
MMLRSQCKNIDPAPADPRHKRKQNEQLDALKNPEEPVAKKQHSKGLTELRAHISGFKIDSAKRAPHSNYSADAENLPPKKASNAVMKIDEDPCPHYDYDLEEAGNPDSVSEYAPDIFKYYKGRESHFRVYDYLAKHPDIDVKTRAILIDWMVEIQETFELNHETLYNAVKLTDMYLSSSEKVDKNAIQKLACVAVFIAAKYDERSPPLVDDLIYLSGDRFSREELLAMERDLFKTVDFDLGSPLSYRYLRRLGRVCRIDMKSLTLARYILETTLLVYDYALVSQCRLAAGAFLLAMKMTDKSYEWSPVLEKYSGYTGGDIIPLMEHMNHTMHYVSNKWNQLVSIRQKYSHEYVTFSSISDIFSQENGFMRLYDPRAQRRPVKKMVFMENPIISTSLTYKPNHVLAANSIGEMALFDLRSKVHPMYKFKGQAGSIRSICGHPTMPLAASVGIDRFLRVHDLQTRKLVHKIYCKVRMNHVLLCDNLSILNDNKAKKENDNDESEYGNMTKGGYRPEDDDSEDGVEEGDDVWGELETLKRSKAAPEEDNVKEPSKKRKRHDKKSEVTLKNQKIVDIVED